MRKANLVTMSDLLYHAEELGYDWNDACDILDGIGPEYEVKSYDYVDSQFLPPQDPDSEPDFNGWYNDARDHSDDCNRIMSTYFEKHDVSDITVIND